PLGDPRLRAVAVLARPHATGEPPRRSAVGARRNAVVGRRDGPTHHPLPISGRRMVERTDGARVRRSLQRRQPFQRPPRGGRGVLRRGGHPSRRTRSGLRVCRATRAGAPPWWTGFGTGAVACPSCCDAVTRTRDDLGGGGPLGARGCGPCRT